MPPLPACLLLSHIFGLNFKTFGKLFVRIGVCEHIIVLNDACRSAPRATCMSHFSLLLPACHAVPLPCCSHAFSHAVLRHMRDMRREGRGNREPAPDLERYFRAPAPDTSKLLPATMPCRPHHPVPFSACSCPACPASCPQCLNDRRRIRFGVVILFHDGYFGGILR